MRSKSVSEIILIRLIDSALTRFVAPSKTILLSTQCQVYTYLHRPDLKISIHL